MSYIYAFGSNGSGQLGIGHTNDVAKPEPCIFQTGADEGTGMSAVSAARAPHVVKVVAGGNHTLMLTTHGTVYAAGRNDDGRCGLPTGDGDEVGIRVVLRQVDFSSALTSDEATGRDVRVTDVAASWEASFVVLDGTRILVCGTGAKGELGLGRDTLSSPTWKQVFEVPSGEVRIVSIAAGVAHVVVALSNGHLFGWGSCRKGQLGESVKKNKILWSPIGVGGDDLEFALERVLAGKDFTVLLATGQNPKIWGEVKSVSSGDVEVLGKHDTMACGWNSIHTLTFASDRTKTQVRSHGKTERGQLAPSTLPHLRYLAAGSEHCLAITGDSKVVAWGWGEHGNCGEDVDSRGSVADRFNIIDIPPPGDETEVNAVWAGCATSFISLKGNG